MVHDEKRSDMWYHDMMTKFSILGNYLHWANFKRDLDTVETDDYIWSGKTKVDMNPDRISLIERAIRGMEKTAKEVEKYLEESVKTEGYYISRGIVNGEENLKSQVWHARCLVLLDEIPKRFRGFRAHKSMSPEEHEILFNLIKERIDELRELLRDRYAFEQDVERREEILKVLGT